MSEEGDIRNAAQCLLEYWSTTLPSIELPDPTADTAALLYKNAHVFADCSVFIISHSADAQTERTSPGYISTVLSSGNDSGDVTEKGAAGYQTNTLAPTIEALGSSFQITLVRHIKAGQQNAASVKVEGPTFSGFLVFLRHFNCWKCISVALAPVTAEDDAVHPTVMDDVMNLCWRGYRQANRSCDGAAMARSFHPTSRLTFVDGSTETLIIKDQGSFCEMVEHRYSKDVASLHQPYAHLREDPRIAAKDSLLAVDFATSSTAMVVLTVGHPPFLWTDLLTCAKIAENNWQIVHKSSCSDSFFVDSAEKAR